MPTSMMPTETSFKSIQAVQRRLAWLTRRPRNANSNGMRRTVSLLLTSDDPNIRYIEKHFSIQRNDDVIDIVRNRVTVYEDSVRRNYEMIEIAAYKDSLATQLTRETNAIKEKLK